MGTLRKFLCTQLLCAIDGRRHFLCLDGEPGEHLISKYNGIVAMPLYGLDIYLLMLNKPIEMFQI